MTENEVLSYLDRLVKKEFDSNHRLLAFDEYLGLLAANPERQTRGTAKLLSDMLDYFGKAHSPNAETQPGANFHFNLFDESIDGLTPKVIGHDAVQSQIYRALLSFTRQGINNKLILLHGPNGSAKSSISHALMSGLEKYSQAPEGASYTFNWIFPVERYTRAAGSD